MAQKNLLQGINEGLRQAMEKDERVVLVGEDIGANGGVFRVTDGLQKTFGTDRVLDTPLAELGIMGATLGLAMSGLRPVCEIQFSGFIHDAFEHIYRTVTANVAFRSDDTHAVNRAIETILTTLSAARRRVGASSSAGHVRQQHVLQRLSHKFGVDEAVLRARLSDLRRGRRRAPRDAAPQGTALDASERELLELLLAWPDVIDRIRSEIDPQHFAPGAGRTIFAAAGELAEAGILPDYERLALAFDEPEIQNVLVQLESAGAAKATESPTRWLEDLLDRFRLRREAPVRQSQSAALRAGGGGEMDIFQQTLAKERARHGIH